MAWFASTTGSARVTSLGSGLGLASASADRSSRPLPDLSPDPLERPPRGRLTLGSAAHKELFCRTLLDTFDPYRPAVIDWPPLDADARARLTSLPIWDVAVQTENLAMRRVKAYADAVADPLLKEALELNAFEEGRHRLVLGNLVEAYGVELQSEPPYNPPPDAEWCFMVTGFGECVDSFFAFGLFEAARRSGFFPPALVDTFEPVIAEEGRHILFFVNWVAWRRRTLPWWRRPWFELKVWAVWIVIAIERMSIAGAVGGDATRAGDNFTLTAADQLGRDIDLAAFLDLCLTENDRRLGKYDARLARPRFVPRLARLAQRLVTRSDRASAV